MNPLVRATNGRRSVRAFARFSFEVRRTANWGMKSVMSESRSQEVGPVTFAANPTIERETSPVLSGGRLSRNGQLSVFATGEVARTAGPPHGSWASLGLALVVLPWVFIGWTIWALT